MPTPPHRILIPEQRIQTRVAELAGAIANDLPVRDPVVVGLLRGSFIFLADLCRALARHDIDAEIDMAWMMRYASDEEPCDLRVVRDVSARIENRAVLLVDDIIDTGLTLHAVHARLSARSPSWLATCVLLDKRGARQVPFEPEYSGFDAPDEWVFGYGLDTNGFGRSLPHVATKMTSEQD